MTWAVIAALKNVIQFRHQILVAMVILPVIAVAAQNTGLMIFLP